MTHSSVFYNLHLHHIRQQFTMVLYKETELTDQNQKETHRAGTNPEVLLLDILDTLINAFVLQHLQRATE